MSATGNQTPPDPGEEPVSFARFVITAKRDLGLGGYEWALVGKGNEVFAAFTSYADAVSAFHERLAQDPLTHVKLRLYQVGREHVECAWPDGNSALERARLVAVACIDLDRIPDGIPAFFRGHFLQALEGEVRVAGRSQKIVELSWPGEEGQWERIGYFLREDNTSGGSADWSLITEHDRRETDPDVIETRLANVINRVIPPEWEIDRSEVRARRRWRPTRVADMRDVLITLAVKFAEEFGLLDRNGEELG